MYTVRLMKELEEKEEDEENDEEEQQQQKKNTKKRKKKKTRRRKRDGCGPQRRFKLMKDCGDDVEKDTEEEATSVLIKPCM